MSDSPAAILYDSGGTEKGTAGNPVRVDPTGTTVQPVREVAVSSLTINAASVVNNTSAQLVPANANRRFLTLTNMSTNRDVLIRFGPTAASAAAYAYRIAPGGTYEMSTPILEAIQAITNTGTASVLVQEYT